MRAIGASNYSAPRLARRARGERRARPAALRVAAAALQPDRARRLRGRARAGLRRATASASSTSTRWRAAFSPASTAAAPTSARACAAAAPKKYLERARPGGPRRARRGRRRPSARRPAQVALAWQIARPSITAPIASATTPAQLDDLVGAAAAAPRRAVDRADRSRQPGRTGMSAMRTPAKTPVDDAGAGLRRRDRHAVDGHPPRLRPLAAADHAWTAAGRARPSPSRSRCRTSPGAWPARSPACWPTAAARSASWSSAACSTPPAWWSWRWRPRALAFLGSAGLLLGMAQAGTTYAVVYGVIGRNVAPEKRSWAMGVTAAAGSFGQFLMVPVEGGLIGGFGWQNALFVLGLPRRWSSCRWPSACASRARAGARRRRSRASARRCARPSATAASSC